MTFQITDVVIYNAQGDRRVVEFAPGSFNIITGRSKTGKTAIADIIGYCLCSDECSVRGEVITSSVAWYGIRIAGDHGGAFIARQAPASGKRSSSSVYVELGSPPAIPDYDQLRPVTNTEGLADFLAGFTGLTDYVHEPGEWSTRPPLEVSIKHALLYCFQRQWEVANPRQLFHKQDDEWVARSLQDTLPYFVGATDVDVVEKRQRLRAMRRKLAFVERRLRQIDEIQEAGLSEAAALSAEAQEVGLLAPHEAADLPSAIHYLEGALQPDRRLQIPAANIGQAFDKLQDDRTSLSKSYRDAIHERSLLATFADEHDGFGTELREQTSRLSSLGLLPAVDSPVQCPTCGNEAPLDVQKSEIAMHLQRLSTQLEEVAKETPRVREKLTAVDAQIGDLRAKLEQNQEALKALVRQHERLGELRDLEARRAYVVGRISHFLDRASTVKDREALERSAAELRADCAKLAKAVDERATKERLDSILRYVGSSMTEYAQALGLEHSRFPLRIDMTRLTVAADTNNGAVFMDTSMGSGENWVGYHLCAHLALHRLFMEQGRPVPRFLILDQPSQVYFPSEQHMLSNEDREALVRMFGLMRDFVATFAPGLQIIVTDHADLKDDWFQAAVTENWHAPGRALVPASWLSSPADDEIIF